MISSSSQSKSAGAPSAAAGKRPAEASGADAKRHLVSDDPFQGTKFSIVDDTGTIVARYADQRQADDALRRYRVVEDRAAVASSAGCIPISSASSVPAECCTWHVPTCSQQAISTAAGCPECVNIKLAQIAASKAAALAPAERRGVRSSLHHVTCRYAGYMYDRMDGCAHCDALQAKQTADAEVEAAVRGAAKLAGWAQHDIECGGQFKRYSTGGHGCTDYGHRCTRCGFER